MPDDERQPPQNEGQGESELPASVIFMEMMRRAAAKSEPEPQEHPNDYAVDDVFQQFNAPQVPFPDQNAFSQAAVPQAVPQNEEAMEEQRIRRVKRRKARRRTRTVGLIGGFTRTVIVAVISAGIMATIFSFWTDSDYFNRNVRSELEVALATDQTTIEPTGLPTPNWLRRIGVVSGHRGPENDPGAVCPDGLTEREITFNVSQLVVRNLRGLGYSVDLLDEFDPRLDNYQAAALLSIHANTCQEWPGGEVVSGYLVAKADARPEGGEDSQLAECIAEHYGQVTQLNRGFNLTIDMTDYHSFREIHPLTPASIIELGYMRADRELLTEKPDALARGITDGILCFLEPGNPFEVATPPA